MYVDNLFATPIALVKAREMGQNICGTWRTNFGFPPVQEETGKLLKEKGDMDFMVHKEKNLLGVVWQDSGVARFFFKK